MTPENPHYLLFSEASRNRSADHTWRFVLQSVGSQRRFSATDTEPSETCYERLELLAVVRGLEALDRPARVTLVTKSRYVSRGIKQGLSEWRASDWQWERFGRVVPVRDHDLWRRVDRALRFHRIDCQAWRFDEPVVATSSVTPSDSQLNQSEQASESLPRTRAVKPKVRRRRTAARRHTPGGLAKQRWAARWSEVCGTVARSMRPTSGATG